MATKHFHSRRVLKIRNLNATFHMPTIQPMDILKDCCTCAHGQPGFPLPAHIAPAPPSFPTPEKDVPICPIYSMYLSGPTNKLSITRPCISDHTHTDTHAHTHALTHARDVSKLSFYNLIPSYLDTCNVRDDLLCMEYSQQTLRAFVGVLTPTHQTKASASLCTLI